MAAHTAPAARGFRISQHKRDVREHDGRALDLSSIHSRLGRALNFQHVVKHSIAILFAAFAAACLATPASAEAADAAQSSGPATLKIWSGAEKPRFFLDDLRGERRALQAFAGKVVLVHFFATWCEPCVREMTSLQKLTDIANGKPLAIDVAEVDLRVRAFFEKRPVTFPVLLDRDRTVTKAWDVSILPSTFVLAPNLTPRLFIESDLDWSRPDVLTAIEALYPTKAGDIAQPAAPHTTAATTNNSPGETTR